jgi:hypothetical protein
VAAALPPATVQALSTDPKLEVGREFATFPEAASRVGRIASATDKLAALHDAVIASAYVDAGMLQELVWAVMPQLAARARGNRAVQHTYSGLFAYHHARNPGPRGGHARPPVDPSKTK